jgi:hypothetical protein
MIRILGYTLHKKCASMIATQLKEIDAHFKKRETEITQSKLWDRNEKAKFRVSGLRLHPKYMLPVCSDLW